MQVASQTHTGCVREHNEDCLAVRQELGLLVLADGMGGHAAGEVASRLAVDTVLAQVEAGQTLEAAIQAAHAAIMAEASANPGKSGMGTTIVAVRLQGMDYQAAWVGDSRIYQLFREHGFERLSQVSRDHTPVQDLLEMGSSPRRRPAPIRRATSSARRWAPVSVSLRSWKPSPGACNPATCCCCAPTVSTESLRIARSRIYWETAPAPPARCVMTWYRPHFSPAVVIMSV